MGKELTEQEEDIWIKNLILPHSLNDIEITNYFNNKLGFNGVSSSNNLPRIKNGAYVINLDKKKTKGTHWFSLFIYKNTNVYFVFFGIEYIPQELLNKIKDK